MTSVDTTTTTLVLQQPPGGTFDEEQMAAASFLARYSGRTLDAYRDDLRGVFQWAHDHHVEVMRATSAHRTVPSVHGTTRTCRRNHRSSAFDGVRLLQVRGHRRDHLVEPRAVRPTTPGPSDRGTRSRSHRVRCVPVHRRALRPLRDARHGLHPERWNVFDGSGRATLVDEVSTGETKRPDGRVGETGDRHPPWIRSGGGW